MEQLAERSWRIGVVWECALRGRDADGVAEYVARWLQSDDDRIDISALPSGDA